MSLKNELRVDQKSVAFLSQQLIHQDYLSLTILSLFFNFTLTIAEASDSLRLLLLSGI